MSLKFKYILITTLIGLAIIATTVMQIWVDHEETKERQQVVSADIAKVVTSHITNSVLQAENMMKLLSDIVTEEGHIDTMLEPQNKKLLKAYCAAIPGCYSIGIINPEGISITNSTGSKNINVSDRLFFKESIVSKKLTIGPAVVTRLENQPILFHISKPIYSPEGHLFGVIAVGMKTTDSSDFYGLMGFGIAPTVAILKSNGDIVARNPDIKYYVGQNLYNGPLFNVHLKKSSHGLFEAVSMVDQKNRMYAYDHNKALNLIVVVGVEHNTAFLGSNQRSMRLLGMMMMRLVLTMAFLGYGYHFLRKQGILKATNDNLHTLAHLDGLTGIPNRRTLNNVLQEEWDKEGNKLTLLLIDIDFFKPYNDNYGHLQGDSCLCQVAQALSEVKHPNIRLVARYGGEEFAVLINADMKKSLQIAESMHAAIKEINIPHNYSTVTPQITISIGMGNSLTANNPEDLISQADQALYKAKEYGRNRTYPENDIFM